MARPSQFANPFYALLIVVGITFAITACAYGVMTVKQLDVMTIQKQTLESRQFSEFMDNRGPLIMIVELAVLAVLTLAAIGTDQYWNPEEPSNTASDLDEALADSVADNPRDENIDSNNPSSSLHEGVSS